MMLSRDAIAAAVEARVEASDFYKPAHGHIFDAVMSLYGQGEPVDPVTVAEELRRAGPARRASAARPRCSQHPGGDAGVGERRALRQDRRRARAAAPARSRSRATSPRWATTCPTTSPRRSTGPSRWSSRSPSGGSPTRWSSISDAARTRPSTSSSSSTAAAASDHRGADRLHRARRPAARVCSRRTSIVVARPSRRGQDRASRSAPRPTSAMVAGGRCCSSRWRWARSSSPSACSRREARVDAARARRPASSPRPTGRQHQPRGRPPGRGAALHRRQPALHRDGDAGEGAADRRPATATSALVVVDYLQLMTPSRTAVREPPGRGGRDLAGA